MYCLTAITTSPSETKFPKVGVVVVNMVGANNVSYVKLSVPLVSRLVTQFFMFALLWMAAVEI